MLAGKNKLKFTLLRLSQFVKEALLGGPTLGYTWPEIRWCHVNPSLQLYPQPRAPAISQLRDDGPLYRGIPAANVQRCY